MIYLSVSISLGCSFCLDYFSLLGSAKLVNLFIGNVIYSNEGIQYLSYCFQYFCYSDRPTSSNFLVATCILIIFILLFCNDIFIFVSYFLHPCSVTVFNTAASSKKIKTVYIYNIFILHNWIFIFEKRIIFIENNYNVAIIIFFNYKLSLMIKLLIFYLNVILVLLF